MTDWLLDGEPMTEVPPGGYEGFCYLITHVETGKKYIGKKSFWTRRLSTAPAPGSKKKRRRRLTKESNWRNYYSSCAELIEDVEKLGPDAFTREVLKLCHTPAKLNYEEVSLQFRHDVLRGNYYNRNIAGRWFRKSD